MSLQIQQNRWEVMVDVADEKGFGNTFKVELVDDGIATGVVRVVYAVGGWPVPFASKDWCDAVRAALAKVQQQDKSELVLDGDIVFEGDASGW